MLETQQFTKLTVDPTKTLEGQIQRAVRKIKPHLTEKEYKTVYPSGSRPGKFYGTAKIHKLKANEGVEKLPIRPIISNINTASYKLAKYLAKLLRPLASSDYTVSSSKDFIDKWKNQRKLRGMKMISFDVTSLFTNVPLDTTIEILLTRIYDKKELKTNIPREDLKALLELCTKQVHFSFENVMYKQSDGVAMGSPLGPVLAGIFMVDLETKVIPSVKKHMTPWWRYVDDTIAYIKEKEINTVLKAINAHHKNIKFTYELESNDEISFLDVKIRKVGRKIETSVYRKPTNTDVYLHWNSFAPTTWKKGTLRTLILRAHNICSTKALFDREIAHLKHVFHDINGYPMNVITTAINDTEEKLQQPQTTTTEETSESNDRQKLYLPYQGKRGETLVKSLNKTLKNVIGTQIKTQIAYKSTRLSSMFNIKDKTSAIHEHNVVYKVQCPQEDCGETYIGETERRIYERVLDHNGRDINSTVFRHSCLTGHEPITMDNVKVIAKGFKRNDTRELTEALLITEQKPTLNIQNLFKTLQLFTT